MSTLTLKHYSQMEAERRFRLPTRRDLFHQRIPTVREGDAKQKMEEIRLYVHNTMELYEKVFECVGTEEGFFVQPVHKLRHPLIFYYGHTACFYINKLCAAGFFKRINPRFEEAFAVGVDEMSWDDLNEEHYSWPTVDEVTEYRRAVRDHVNELISSGVYKLNLPLTFENSTASLDNSFWWVILMCAEHERIHVETASVHVRELPMRFINPAMSSFWQRCHEVSSKAPVNELIEVGGDKVHVGREPNSSVYGWDCDYSDGNYVIEIPTFKASKYVVSNAEFMAFIKADGYNTQRYWDEEGWKWVQWKKPQHPWFWVRDESRPDGYALRLQTELIDLPWNWPCEVNNLEAHAFCRFKSEKTGNNIRMLTEAEWLLLWDRHVGKDQMCWENKAPGNLNLEHFQSSCPVDKFQHGSFFDIVGNVWQHCETKVYPYPGYNVHPFYDDFSMPTFDGRHACMKGGTWVSSGNEATRDARFAFRRHFFQYIGLRYVEAAPANEERYYRSVLGLDPEVDVLTEVSFGEPVNGIPNGCVKIAEYAIAQFKAYAKVEARCALDFACGAGRVSFEMSAFFGRVIGADFTARHLIPAYALLERGTCTYSTLDASSQKRVGRLAEASNYSWGDTRNRVTFLQSDPANLHSHMTNFSLIVCWNTLERALAPAAVPPHLLGRLEEGGLLVIGGQYEWIEGRSPVKEYWDATASSRVGIPEEEVYKLLGAESAVERVGDPIDVMVAFPASDRVVNVKKVYFTTYRKKVSH
ncbi:generic methyltransferase [Trypanosoma rangeli]|uniref:Generic methyltransferase n=1 Tax=Trypanosoma rangeli TaxID=5698 RepID=A0A422NF05_TRYRA|nr:generic methyltransferase [Trypanosoma rangeli]RNF04048.1 generic methyltransferase [Trypanosoma rangeli]|eukprot:RNF04048.1 generic methyltransferase [Trypanosoma rangeli]